MGFVAKPSVLVNSKVLSINWIFKGKKLCLSHKNGFKIELHRFFSKEMLRNPQQNLYVGKMQIKPIQETDDIDLILTLHPHGWSTCCIFIHGDRFELTISHVFGNPYLDFINALTKLIKGNNAASIFWYREPGGERIEIKKLKERTNVVRIKISSFKESYGHEIKEYDETVEFEIQLKCFIILSYIQLKKTHLLLKDKNYSTSRRNDFPGVDFIKFEEIVKEYISIDN